MGLPEDYRFTSDSLCQQVTKTLLVCQTVLMESISTHIYVEGLQGSPLFFKFLQETTICVLLTKYNMLQ